MKVEAAFRCLRELPRYDRHVTKVVLARNKHGNFIRNLFLPKATRRQVRAVLWQMDEDHERVERNRFIEVDSLVTEQETLIPRRLAYQLRRFDKMQKGRKLPLVVPTFGGKYLIWDGNHRCTVAVLLAKRRIQCRVMTRMLKKRVKRG